MLIFYNSRASEDAVFAPGQAIESQLKKLAERRTDIFGVGEDAAHETGIGKKIGGEEEDKASIRREEAGWDGHTVSAETVARAARAKISLEDQIQENLRQKGLMAQKDAIGPKAGSSRQVPPAAAAPPAVRAAPPIAMVPMGMPRSAMPPVNAPPPQPYFIAPQSSFAPPPGHPMMPPMPAAMMDPDEPANKRARGEDHLIPENVFAQQNPSPVTFQVVCPVMAEKSDWNLTGQAIAVTLPLNESISAVKTKIHEATGMPPGKQKLQLDPLFLKDANSLAYYNVRPGMVIMLQIKERGGRKK